MQTQPISIHQNSIELKLPSGKYHLLIVGGWLVYEVGFHVKLVNKENNAQIRIRRSAWPVQTFVDGKRAKRYYDFEIVEGGVYELNFINPKSLSVKKSNLVFFSLWFKEVDNQTLTVVIEQDN